MFYAFLLLVSCVFAEPMEKSIKFKLTRVNCAKIIINNKADSSVNYQPGVDARGRKVVPADLERSPATKNYGLGDEVHINLQTYLGKFKNKLPTPQPGQTDFVNPVIENSEVGVGKIDIDKDGKIRINGIPAFDEDQAKIEAACRKKFPNL